MLFIMVNDDDFFDSENDSSFDNFKDSSIVNDDWKNQDMGFDTFRLRNDPTALIKEIKYYLMQVEESKDSDNRVIIVRKKNPFNNKFVEPIVNQQGVEEICMLLRTIINNHSVMGNTLDDVQHLNRMYYVSSDLLVFFWSKRKKWDLSIDNVNPLIQFLSAQIDMFLSRTINDLERGHYDGNYTENRDLRPIDQSKKNFLSGLVPGVFRNR